MKHIALRSFFYTDVQGQEVLATEGDEIIDASDGKIAALLADGLIKEARASAKKED